MNTTQRAGEQRSDQPRAPLPCIQFTRPRCPDCGSVRLASRSSRDQGDGSKLRYSVCRDCGLHLTVIAE